jgi:hypothetical protein
MRIVIALALALTACASSSSSDTAAATQSSTPETVVSRSKSARPAIATLETQNRKVSILSGTNDPEPLRVLVRDQDGKVLADGVTIDELSRTDPALSAIITNATAKNDGTYLDATYVSHARH